MNDPNKMKPICHDCPYWEACEPPYDCHQTEKKYRSLTEETLIQQREKRNGMKASELIAILTELMEKHGDVTVMMTVDWTSSVCEATYHEAKDGDISDGTSWIPYIELT